ncbi:hypothetical protein QFZ48_004085 [Chitinophaga sp. W2I13]|uniref:hypothetical protein n=1 Tax=Chitinophaga sp. W2I13 TaxID=3373923 RepID=UPI003D1CA520
MNFQFERINLNQRLSKEINTFLSNLSFMLHEAYEQSGNNKYMVSYYLNGTAKNLRNRLGTNYWRPVLIQALADHDGFCDGGFYEPLALTR